MDEHIVELNAEYVEKLLSGEKSWETGKTETFMFNNWTITLRKEEPIYPSFTYSLSGNKENSRETWTRRYTSMEKALLHIFNRFNENSKIKNRYETLEKALKSLGVN